MPFQFAAGAATKVPGLLFFLVLLIVSRTAPAEFTPRQLIKAKANLLRDGTAREHVAKLDKGHRILLEHGLQIQAQAFYEPALSSYAFDAKRYFEANFTGVNWH